ncbi:hypothetical protein TNCV_3099271 [Trichonephila clavipes]|nr:hypothetical protein TNCV_3099271 [Trichonephila clavipes]
MWPYLVVTTRCQYPFLGERVRRLSLPHTGLNCHTNSSHISCVIMVFGGPFLPLETSPVALKTSIHIKTDFRSGTRHRGRIPKEDEIHVALQSSVDH